MVCHYNNKMASKCGINSALIAGYVWHNLRKDGKTYDNKVWVRAGRKKLMAVFPFMGEKAIGKALKRLEKADIIIKQEHNDSSFDRTLSFAFTTYGKTLMEGDEQSE